MQAARGASLNPSEPAHPPDPRGRAPRSRRSLLILAAIALVGYALDLTTKVLAVRHLSDGTVEPLVGDLLTLRLVRNPGAAFSTGTSYTLVLSLVALVAAGAVLWFARRLASTGWAIGLGFLLAGILGNLTDRTFRSPGFLRGHVVDFLQLPHWPIFNVADMCINVAAGVIIIQALRGVGLDGRRSSGGGRSGRAVGSAADDPTGDPTTGSADDSTSGSDDDSTGSSEPGAGTWSPEDRDRPDRGS